MFWVLLYIWLWTTAVSPDHEEHQGWFDIGNLSFWEQWESGKEDDLKKGR